jgi:predicted SnoaL-like aldol condensation-catalyzing enzyme
MKVLSPSRLAVVAAVAATVLTLGVTGAFSGGGHARTTAACDPLCQEHQRLERNKKNVVAYYTLAFNAKKPVEAVAMYGGPMYIQHNPLAGNGFKAFIGFVQGFTKQFPKVHIQIKRVFAEGNYVITHGLLTGAVPVYGKLGSKVVDIFRVNSAGKVVEHWDVLAPISAKSLNGNPEV